jgi:hypothetical protein
VVYICISNLLCRVHRLTGLTEICNQLYNTLDSINETEISHDTALFSFAFLKIHMEHRMKCESLSTEYRR